ncbi:zf-TFIIB domain-containing protein [Micromonospora sp. NBC_01655]|uniref:TFIIB-type zinc ribbon-containing protein n=1 Tax=unclassified Micromonospora TaxID=2617518 RepID=UPI000E43043A|nr:MULTISPECIES: zf-TFIIB domain-containing protein [unclassified Micromonospora]MCX4469236.1 zf-TFIIB domain-containing protein [Micromonospora sp. NBC_01655]
MMQLTCPKCHGDMRQYERSGVVIDQCGECRGIFLDRGELEKLFEAEANWNRQQSAGAPNPAQRPQAPGGYPPPPPPAHQPQQPGYGAVPPPPPPPPAHGYPPAAPAYGGHGQHYGYHGHYRRKKHHGFLGELFD